MNRQPTPSHALAVGATRYPSRVRANESTIQVLDLFAGAGGLTQGLHESSARYRVAGAVEMDRAAAETYKQVFGEVMHQGRIEDWLQTHTVPDVDLVVGGPPCQGFSALGRQDADDARNQMWRHYAKTVALAAPKYFVLENVPQFLKSPEFQIFCKITETGGELADYVLTPHTLNAADYGAPQARKRVVVIGRHRDMEDPGEPQKTHVDAHVTVGEALRGIKAHVTEQLLPEGRFIELEDGKMLPGEFKTTELHLTRNFEQLSLDRFASIPIGGNRFDLPDELKAPCWRRHTTGSGDVMGRLHSDRPSVTIRTEFFKPEKGRYLHPTENRAITHFEAARLQGFPDDYKWVGSKTAIAKQIGNAVPIKLASAIGTLLSRHL
ncbi:DNA cytosine methyltransferase [Rhodococcus sp. ARP2]|uniref:DNA cytosine methyltransferase n=1 Tax=Rhodococcus sp. ARP2 TaxID=1661385 RepID=UPI0009E5CF77